MIDGKLDLTETVGIIADANAPALNITAVSEEVVAEEELLQEETPPETPTEENTEG